MAADPSELSPASLRAYVVAHFAAAHDPSDKSHDTFVKVLKTIDEDEAKGQPPKKLDTYRIAPIKLARQALLDMHDNGNFKLMHPEQMSLLLMAKLVVDEITKEFDIIKKQEN